MSQSQAVRKRILQHIWRKSEGMTQSASEWDGEIPQAHCEEGGMGAEGHAITLTQNLFAIETKAKESKRTFKNVLFIFYLFF